MPQWIPSNDPHPIQLQEPQYVTTETFYIEGPYQDAWGAIICILIDGSFYYSIVDGFGSTCQSRLRDNTLDIMFFPANFTLDDELIDIYGVIG